MKCCADVAQDAQNDTGLASPRLRKLSEPMKDRSVRTSHVPRHAARVPNVVPRGRVPAPSPGIPGTGAA